MTVKEALERRLAKSVGQSGACADSPEALAAINEARQMIYMEDDDYVDTTSWARVVVYSGVFWIPPHIQSIRSAYSVCGTQIPIGGWYQSMTHQFARSCQCSGRAEVGATGMCDLIPNAEATRRSDLIGFSANSADDYGKVISLDYLSDSGAQLTEDLTLGPEPARTAEPLRLVVSVTKPRTKGSVAVQRGDNAESHLIQPWEEEPKYERVIARGQRELIVFGRKKFRFLDFRDVMDITNPMAIEAALKALAFRDDTQRHVTEIQLMQRHMEKADSYMVSADEGGCELRIPSAFSVGYPEAFVRSR